MVDRGSGRELTSLIGELSVCQQMNLKWDPSEGYDAKAGDCLYQIKTRKPWVNETVDRKGRLGRFGTKKGYRFDIAVYAELDHHFEVVHIWRMERDKVKELESKEASNRGLHVHTFRSNAEEVV